MAALIDASMAAWSRTAGDWFRFWTDVNRSVAETNRQTATALGLDAADVDRTATHAALPSMDYRHPDWTVERSVDAREDIGVGDYVRFSKHLSERDVESFALASGDTNRLHLDPEFAARSRFGERIAHGTLVTGLVSAALARLPGLVVYLSQDVQYLAPVPVGERATATCEVVEDLGGDRFRLTTAVTDEAEETVLDGEAVVLVDELPADADA